MAAANKSTFLFHTMSTSRPQRAAKASMKTYTEDDSDIEDPMGGVSDDNEAKIHSGLPRKSISFIEFIQYNILTLSRTHLFFENSKTARDCI